MQFPVEESTAQPLWHPVVTRGTVMETELEFERALSKETTRRKLYEAPGFVCVTTRLSTA